MSLSLRAGRAALAEDMGMTLLPRAHPIMALCCWRCALSCAMSEVEVWSHTARLFVHRGSPTLRSFPVKGWKWSEHEVQENITW